MANPFVYAKPVGPEDIVDREEEARRLLELALGGHNSRLSAPRRYGKTSLARKLLTDAEAEGLSSVYVNCFGALSLDDVALRIDLAYRSTFSGPVRDWLRGLIRGLRPTFSPPGTGVTISPAPSDPTADQRALLDLLDLPLRILERTQRRTVVVFDEFQDVLRVRPAVDGLLRSRIELHGDAASYVFAGSHPRMMAELFAERSRPFYGQATLVGLGPLEAADLAEHLGARFAATGKHLGGLLELLLDAAGGHPQRAMLLAHHAWEQTPLGGEADEALWEDTLAAVYLEVRDELEATWQGLDETSRRVIAAIALHGATWTRGEVLTRFVLARTTAREAATRLGREGFLAEDGSPRLVDPLLARWIAAGRQGLG